MANSARSSLYSSLQPTVPLTPIRDTFNRANQGPPPSANWTSPFADSYGSGTGDTGKGLEIIDNVVVCEDLVPDGHGVWSAEAYGPDAEVYATLWNGFGPDTYDWDGFLYIAVVLGNGVTTHSTGYYAQLMESTQNNGTVQITRMSPLGGGDTISSATNLHGWLDGTLLAFRYIEGTLSVSANGKVITSVFDDTYIAQAGYIGCGVASNDQEAGWNDFGGGTLKTTSTFETATNPAADTHLQRWGAP